MTAGGLTRRGMLAGLAGLAAGAAGAEAPLTSPRPPRRPDRAGPASLSDAPAAAKVAAAQVADLIAEAKLGGDVTFLVADAKTGLILEARGAERPMPPASTAKAITSLYALAQLGRDHRFVTRVLATGPVTGGRLDGDLILTGGGDPVLNSDDLGDMVAGLKAKGLREVSGRFLIWGGALAYLGKIDADQPDYLGYNPCLSGMNLNFNRVNFTWAGSGDSIRLGMDARGERFVPEVGVVGVRVADRDLPVFTYDGTGPREMWTVARSALNRDGSRWLPVRRPEIYAGDVFRALAAAQGIRLPAAEVAERLPEGAGVLLSRESAPLPDLLRDMMKFSTNLTAEVIGMTASARLGITGHGASGQAMSDWLRREGGGGGARFVDHSGLGGASRISAGEMVRALVKLGPKAGLRGLMKEITVRDMGGKGKTAIRVEAKTGTLNFVSALVGYMTGPDGTEMAFAIYTGDPARRDAVPDADKESPPGAGAWVKRSKRLQLQLIERWARVYGS